MEYAPRDYLLRARDAESRGDHDTEIEVLQDLVSLCGSGQKPGEYCAEALRRLGNAFQSKNQIVRAHNYRLESLNVIRALGSHCSAETSLAVHGDLGRSFIELREWNAAESYITAALAIAAASVGDKSDAVCTHRMSLAVIYANTNRGAEAIKLGEEVLACASKVPHPHQILALHNLNLASVHLQAGQFTASQEHARRASGHAQICHDERTLRLAKKMLAQSECSRWRETAREDYAEQAERLLRQLAGEAAASDDYSLLADTELELAKLASRKDEEGARCHYEAAIAAIERLRAGLGFDELREGYFGEWTSAYEECVAFQVRRGDSRGAFLTSEQSKSRLFNANLGRRLKPSLLPTDARAERLDVLNRYGTAVIETARSDLATGRLRRIFGSRAVNRVEVGEPPAIREARNAYVRLLERQRLHNIQWSSRLRSPCASARDVQNTLGQDDALLAYNTTKDMIIAFALTNDSIHVIHIPYERQDVNRDVQELCHRMAFLETTSLERLQNPILRREWWSRRPDQAHPDDINAALRRLRALLEKMFEALVQPLMPVLHAKRNWLVVPHGSLHRVPWSALWSGRQYVVEEHNVAVLPSATFAAGIQQQFNRDRGVGALLLGAPDSSEDVFGLPGAESELHAATRALNLSGSPAVGNDATKALFLTMAPRAALIHVAAHHFFDASAPGLSFVRLAGDEGTRFLHACEVTELDLGAQLVVLSACETARSYLATGDEQYGMVRSFLGAGVRSVISTLWAIEDESAGHFFAHFYREALDRSLIEAIGNAQRAMIRTRPYDIPYFWASYILSGEWRKPLSIGLPQ